ncbi:MAG: substrate-binding domain-containing protein, partial [Bifidobacteriaceae bacterium]|nr:substrate-binding domain-containing protein [Bifidobacteriaceae bacterium]
FMAIPLACLGVFVATVVGTTLTRGRTKRVLGSILAAEALTGVWIVYAVAAGLFHELVGMIWLPVLTGLGALVITLFLIWQPFTPRVRLVSVVAVGLVIISMIAGVAARGVHDSRLLVIGDSDLQLDVGLYEPFITGTLATSLEDPSRLHLTDDLPRLDGATALYPLYASFVRATYPERRYDPYGQPGDSGKSQPAGESAYSEVVCSTTPYAFEALLDGTVDVAFLMGVSDEQASVAEEAGLELELTPIGREAFVFFVSKRNPVSNLTAAQIRQIYSGQIENWSAVGGRNHQIDAYQRNEGSGSQTAFEEIMGSVEIMIPPHSESAMGPMVESVLAYKNSNHAIGFSFRYYLDNMIRSDEIKMLSIDGVAPTRENVASGAYPFTIDFYAVTATESYANYPHGEDDPLWDELGGDMRAWRDRQAPDPARTRNAQRLIDWARSPEGQELVEKVGYVPLAP